MKKNIRAIIKSMTAGATAILLCVLAVMPSFAAIDPPMGLGGNEPGGVMVVDGKTDLALEGAELIFDISDLPDGVMDDVEQLLAYNAHIKATYTLYNPTDLTVTEQLATPLACNPYFDRTEDENADAYKFTVEINGQRTQTKQRHTYYSDPYYYVQGLAGDTQHLANGLAYLSAECAANPVLQPDAPVYVYTYLAALALDDAEDHSFNVSGSVKADPDTCAVLTDLIVADVQGKQATLNELVFKKEEFTVCSVGTDVGEIDWTVKDYDGNEGDVNVTLTSRQSMTLYEFVMQGYDAEYGASEQDYYLAVMAYADLKREQDSAFIRFGDAMALEPYELIPWQLFDVTLAPGERVSVTVTAPIYPCIHDYYNPPVYTYAFAMTQDDAWSSCGTTRVRVITDLLLSRRERMLPEIGEYTESEDGYTWEGQGDFNYFVFSVCEKQKPFDSSIIALLLYLLVILIVLFVCVILPVAVPLVIIALIILLIVIKVRKKRRAAKQLSPQPEKITETEKEEKEEKEENDDA